MKIGNINYRQYLEDTKKFRSITDNSKKCKCGHSILIGTQKKRICSYCGRWVFKNKHDEFEYRLKEQKINLEV